MLRTTTAVAGLGSQEIPMMVALTLKTLVSSSGLTDLTLISSSLNNSLKCNQTTTEKETRLVFI